MFNKPHKLKKLRQEQRRLLQQSQKEKSYRELQRRIKKEIPGAELYLYRDITPSSLGEFVYILDIAKGDDYLGQITGITVSELIKKTEEWLDE